MTLTVVSFDTLSVSCGRPSGALTVPSVCFAISDLLDDTLLLDWPLMFCVLLLPEDVPRAVGLSVILVFCDSLDLSVFQ
jgi:hypothetical protein